MDSLTASSSSCNFAAAAGIIPSANTIEPLMPTISADGRLVSYVSNFDVATVRRAHDASGPRGPATHIVYLYDRVLGITTSVTQPTPSQIGGIENCCCPGCASSSYSIGSCSWNNRLLGRCCDQKPCRLGGLNAEISADGEKIVFVSDVDYGGSGDVPKGDLEIFVHHIPTDTTHRITHTYDPRSDETFPHLSADGTVVTWEARAHYGETVAGEHNTNRDIWTTRLTYGCDDPTSLNYLPDADIAECCRYSEASLDNGGAVVTGNLVLRVNLTHALSQRRDATAEETCTAWAQQLRADIACAMRIPLNRVALRYGVTCADLATVWIDDRNIIPHSMESTVHFPIAFRSTYIGSGESSRQLFDRLQAQLKDERAAIWKGRVTRFAFELNALTYDSVWHLNAEPRTLFTLNTSNPYSMYTRGDLERVSIPYGSGTRRAYQPKISGNGALALFHSDSDISGIGRGDNVYTAWAFDVATNRTLEIYSTTDRAHDTSYPSSNRDGSLVCFLSNAGNRSHPNHDTSSPEKQWWLASRNADGTFATPRMISWSSGPDRGAKRTCQVSDDGVAVVFETDSAMAGGAHANEDEQVFMTLDGGETTMLLSGDPNNPGDPAGITPGSDCDDPAVSSNGNFVAIRCIRKQHWGSISSPGYTPTSDEGAVHEGWLYDRANNRLSMFAALSHSATSACAYNTATRSALQSSLQTYWGTSSAYDFAAAGITGVSSSSCEFAAVVGIQSGVNTRGIGASSLSIDEAGRFIAYDTNFQMATVSAQRGVFERLTVGWGSTITYRHCC